MYLQEFFLCIVISLCSIVQRGCRNISHQNKNAYMLQEKLLKNSHYVFIDLATFSVGMPEAPTLYGSF